MMRKILVVLTIVLCSISSYASHWHFPLYLDGGTPAKNRIEIEISNQGDIDAEGSELKISAKELGLVGKSKKSIRVVSGNHRELLWTVVPDTKKLNNTSQIIIPIDCKAKKSSKVWLYYNIPEAYEQPDYYVPTSNFSDSFETYKSIENSVWDQKDIDVNHKSYLTTKYAHSGKKSVCSSIVPNSKPSFFATKKQFKVTPGDVTVSMYVKCENIIASKDQGAGFYVALFGSGKGKKTQFFYSDRLTGTHDWTKLEVKAKIPEGYYVMNIGTYTYAQSGDAYYDTFDYNFKSLPVKLSYTLKKPERLSLKRIRESNKWDVSPDEYDVRFKTSIFNVSGEKSKASMGYIPVKRVCAGNFSMSDFALFKGGKKLSFMLIDDILIFPTEEFEPKSENEYSLYLKRDRKNQIVQTGGTKQASYVMSDQLADTRSAIDFNAYEKLVNSPSNMVGNPSFEDGLKVWYKRYNTTNQVEIVDGGLFGKKALRVKIDPPKEKDWYGLHQDIKNISAGKNYIYITAIKTNEGVVNVPRLRLYQSGMKESFYFEKKTRPAKDWQISAVIANNNLGDARVQLGVINTGKSDFLVDGTVFAECYRCEKYKAETAFDLQDDKKLALWQVNSVIKVFPFYAPPKEDVSANISLAKNEAENLQIALRSKESIRNLEIEVSEAVSESGAKLKAQQIAVAKYVIIDAKSHYNAFTHLKFHELCVPPASMAELYPDPLIPENKIDLKRGKTEAVWLTFQTDENTKAGIYKGKVDFKKDGEVVGSIPYSVKVFDFAIPKETSLTAIFDKRSEGSNGGWRSYVPIQGVNKKFYDRYQLQEFMATKRATLDKPERLEFKWVNGKYEVDFTEFDKFCELTFDKLGLPLMYLNVIPGHAFALPLPLIDKVKPYEGEWPYSNTKDYTKLRPEYIERVKGRMKLVYDHIREKGWVNKFIMFMSDEPYYWEKHIADMLNTYFGLIHSVAPDAKVYTSTWGYAEPLEKQVDVWGLNMSSANTPSEIVKIDKQKQRKIFTTDGNYCIDTPYNAQERIMAAFCYAGGFLGYEYWGVDWHMRNHLKWGFHMDRISSPVPNVKRRNRFPNGDGYFIYSGEVIGRKEIFSSVRMEVVRDGQEDYEYFILLEKLAKETGDKLALATLEKVKSYAVYPNPGARNSTELLPNPDAYTIQLRNEIASHIERLSKK